ncbi:MAG: AAA family ATPase [Deltaproteobacteria bacterium]|jgi:hypothetical protein|nr:AAA family ATPase [Deltaproteobacteria bacterium]
MGVPTDREAEQLQKRSAPTISHIEVSGFKSIRDPLRIALRPLTLLAGQNSAGKSSALQPLLLLKQTLEAPHDPGPLLLDGACVKVSLAADLFWRAGRAQPRSPREWTVGVQVAGATRSTTRARSTFGLRGGRLALLATEAWVVGRDEPVRLWPGMPEPALRDAAQVAFPGFLKMVDEPDSGLKLAVVAERGCVRVRLEAVRGTASWVTGEYAPLAIDPIRELIHLPGLRGNPERSYPVTGVTSRYLGSFHPYTASVLLAWQDGDDALLGAVGDDLAALGLTWKVVPSRVDDTRVAVRVGRLPKARRGGAADLVNIADVGFGASQVLPVVVALRAARPGQLVHIEQPEIHLHPNAQVEMARLLVAAAQRGVRLVVETHSAVLLKAIQIEVAEGRLAAEDVALHWFTRAADGATVVAPGQLDPAGAYGDWPVDFADVELGIEQRYIDAAFAKLGGAALGQG